MRRLVYVNNRYRHYDRVKYRTLAASFDLRVVWIGPPPEGEAPPTELVERFRNEILDPKKRSKLQPWHLIRSLRLFRRLRFLSRNADLVVSSTSDSWKSKVAFAAAAGRAPVAFRKERWLDLSTPVLTRPYWLLDQFLTDWIEKRARGVLVGGRKAREYLLERGHAVERILQFSYLHEDLAEEPPDAEIAAELERFKGRSLLLLYLGRIMPQKGLDCLIRIVRKMIAAGEDVKLVVVGEPIYQRTGRGGQSSSFYDRCRRLAEKEPRIEFRGAVAAESVHDYYRAADVFVHPHVFGVGGREKADGWGNVLTEAASLSMPVIASDRVGSAFDIVDDGMSGFLLRSRRLEVDLEAALTHFCRHPEAIESFGQKARKRYETVVDANRTVASIQELMDSRDQSEGASR